MNNPKLGEFSRILKIYRAHFAPHFLLPLPFDLERRGGRGGGSRKGVGAKSKDGGRVRGQGGGGGRGRRREEGRRESG